MAQLSTIWKELIQEKGTQSIVQCSKYCDDFHIIYVYYFYIILLTFIYFCCEKAHDNKKLVVKIQNFVLKQES